MNVELLNQVKIKIYEEPAKLDMRIWRFGAFRCIGGFILDLLSDEEKDSLKINDVFGMEFDNAVKALDISIEEGNKLFPLAGWPREFYDKFTNATIAKERAAVALMRIDYFIWKKE